MYTRREIKTQGFKCWSNQFITNVNKGDEERGGQTLLRVRVKREGRKAIAKNRKKARIVKAGISHHQDPAAVLCTPSNVPRLKGRSSEAGLEQ